MTPREIAWKLRHDRSRILMMTSFLDDAGDYGDPNETITCVAGCVASETAWNELRRDWRSVLADPRFDVPYLHMKEYAH